MPGVSLMSQESWKQVRMDIMTGKRRKKSRHKLSMAKICSCMAAQTDDFPEDSRPYEKKGSQDLDSPKSLELDKRSLEPAETTQNAEPSAAAPGAKVGLEVTNEEPEPAQDIEIPPPMAIQDHSFKPKPEEPEDAVTKLASLNLKAQPDAAANSVDLANEIENIIKQRSEPSAEVTFKSESSAEDDAGGEEPQEEEGEKDAGETDVKDAEAERIKYLRKRQFVIQELYDTEKVYVDDLGSIVEGYMGYMKENPLPGDLEGKDKIVFGNIHQIYDWHKETMVMELEKCLTETEKVGSIFIRYERRLYMYVKYCENKPKSEYIVSEYLDTYFEEIRQKLGHRLTLPDLLIKPVQRIMRYQLLIRDILKYTEKAGLDTTDLKKALRVMCIVPKAANDMMQVGRLQGFDGKITAQGKLLLQDTLLVSEVVAGMAQKARERRVFLFEQIIIFSEMLERKKGDFSNASYIYKNSLKVNKMSMANQEEGEPLKFVLIDRTPGSDMKYIIQAPSEEVKDTWIREIRSILDMQGDFLRALQSPIAYQREISKELSAPEFGSMPKDSVLRKTQSHPASGTKNSSPLAASGKKGRQDSEKHKRCKSVPMPLPEITGEQGEDSSFSKLSCPNSPTETSKDSVSQRKSSPVGDSRSESPKPKKTNFRGIRSLQRKAKNEGGSGAGGNSSGGGQMSSSSTATAASATTTTETYANMHSMPDIVQDSGGRTSSTEPGVARAPLSQPTDTDQVPVSASSLTS